MNTRFKNLVIAFIVSGVFALLFTLAHAQVLTPTGMDSGGYFHIAATGDTLSNLTESSIPNLTSDLANKMSIPTGTTLQYILGDGTLTTFPTIPAAQLQSDWNEANTGLLDYIKNKPTLTSGTVTSVVAGTGLSGGTITSTGTISLPNTGTAGTYSTVTTDTQGRVTAGTNRSWNNAPARSIVTGTGATGFQPSSTKDTLIKYGIKVVSTASIASGQEGYVTLEIAATNSATPSDWVNMGLDCGNGQTYSLAIALQGIQPTYCEVSGTVPAGWYAKLRSINVTGTPTYTYLGGQEMSF